jgi:large subunit ribosomal protein L4
MATPAVRRHQGARSRRAEVRGGGKQAALRRRARASARAGSSRSPIWVGGGRDLRGEARAASSRRSTARCTAAAMRSMLAQNWCAPDRLVVTQAAGASPRRSTRLLADELKKLSRSQSALIVDRGASTRSSMLAARNLPHVEVLHRRGR